MPPVDFLAVCLVRAMARVSANVRLVVANAVNAKNEMAMVFYEDFNLIVPKKGLKAVL